MSSLRFLTRGSGLKSNAPETTALNLQNQPADHQNGNQAPSQRVKKRKRTEDDGNDAFKSPKLSTEEIRQAQKTHKIKITDLKSLLNSDEDANRKAQKEAARLYPQPLQSFTGLKQYEANHALLSNIAEQGYKEPTEVQLATIPLLIDAETREPNLLTVAPTGSGKTLAFLIPTIDKISKLHHDEKSNGTERQIHSIVLAPTKELVTQIVNEGRKLASRTGVRITAFKKGMRIHEDIRAHSEDEPSASEAEESLKHTVVKADIVVSTPLSLLHAIIPPGQDIPPSLPNIRNLILDEADVLLDQLFREQTLAIWSACANKSLRTSLWSATIGSNIEELTLAQINTHYFKIGLKSKHQPPLIRCIIGLKDTSLPNISHRLIYASTESGKLTGLRNLIRPPPSSSNSSTPPLHPPYLIFTQSISRAEALHSELQYDIPPASSSSIPRIALLHASLSDSARSSIMQNFRLGKIWILITTDLLSRGIDFRGVNAVINYDIPTTSAAYVHRAGRTGRAGREGGACITLYTRDDVAYLRPIANLIQRARKAGGAQGGEAGSESEIPKWLMDALPVLSKDVKKDLKKRGVDVRRGVKESDDKKERRRKGRNVIGTRSGYEKKLENRRKGMVEGSKRRKEREMAKEGIDDGDGEDAGFGGFD